MKKIIATLLLIVSFSSLAGCAQDKSDKNQVAYIDTGTSSSAMSQKDSEKTPEQVAQEEDNHAEQVVVQVTDEGYVTSHGDHYHFYSGKVGFEALISRDLVLNDPAYVLEQSHIVSDVTDGHIIKLDGQYYLYLTTSEPQHVR